MDIHALLERILDAYAAYGQSLGIRHVFSAPLVRSSYQAGNFIQSDE